MTRKSGLGKGLDSLIPNSSTVPSTKSTKFSTKSEENVDKPVENPVDIPKTSLKLSQIEPNRDQPRKNFDLDALEELAESIRRHGVLQPLLVQEKDRKSVV